MSRIAIIGAGIAGLILARELDGLAALVLFEKSRGYGGRMATRRAGAFQFDHGAQFFSAKTAAFRQYLEPFVTTGVVARWDAAFVEFQGNRIVSRRDWRDGPAHYVGVPAMNALPRSMSDGLEVRLETRVARVAKTDSDWRLEDADGLELGRFDWVVLAIPATQARELVFACDDLEPEPPMQGCYSLMLGFDEPPAIDWQAAFVSEADISWISLDSSKPGRPDAPALLVHSTNRWAEAHLETSRDDVVRHLGKELHRVAGIDSGQAGHVDLHRWRYANVGRQAGSSCWIDPEQRLGAIGDWFVHGRVEAAFSSACDLAHLLRAELQ